MKQGIWKFIRVIGAIRWPSFGQFLLAVVALIQLVPTMSGLLNDKIGAVARIEQPDRYWMQIGVGLGIGIPLSAAAFILYLRNANARKS